MQQSEHYAEETVLSGEDTQPRVAETPGRWGMTRRRGGRL